MPSRKSSLENLALARLNNPNFQKRGRKKGQLMQKTIDTMKAKKKLDQKFLRAIAPIAEAQISLARGLSFLYKVHTNEKGIRSRPEKITDESVIESYLSGDLDDNDENDFYYITTTEPNNQAIDSIFNRVFGKPKETVDMTVEVFSLKALADKRKQIVNANDVRLEENVVDVEAEEVEDDDADAASPSDSPIATAS